MVRSEEWDESPATQPQMDYRGPGDGKAVATMAPKQPSPRELNQEKPRRSWFFFLFVLAVVIAIAWHFAY